MNFNKLILLLIPELNQDDFNLATYRRTLLRLRILGFDVEEVRKYSKESLISYQKDKSKQTRDTLKRSILNTLTYDITKRVTTQAKKLYSSNKKRIKARWLPSSSQNPSAEHEQNYYKLFYLNKGIDGELPNQRPNCQCTFEIETNKKDFIDLMSDSLNLSDKEINLINRNF